MAKPSEDGVIGSTGKPNPPEGENHYVFTGVAKLCGETKETVQIEAEYALDPEGTKSVMCFCYLGNEKGLESLMTIIVETGVYKKLMAKDKSLPDPSEGWDDDDVLKNMDFLEQLGIELVGCEAYITTKDEPNEYENKKGITVKSTNARVISIRKYDGKAGKKADATASADKDAKPEEEDWQE